MITTAALKSQSLKDLTALAKKRGLAGWQSMKKDQLVRALARPASKPIAKAAAKSSSKSAKPVPPKPAPAKKPAAGKKAAPLRTVAKLKPAPKAAAPTKAKPVAARPAPQARPAAAPPAKNGAQVKPTAASAKLVEAKPPLKAPAKPAPTPVAPKQPLLKPLTSKTSAAKPPATKAKPAPAPPATQATNGAKPHKPTAAQAKVSARIHQAQANRDRLKDLSGSGFRPSEGRKGDRDRIVLLVRDSYWLQALWNVTRAAVKRAEAALAEHWHTARPILRLLEVGGGATTSTSERIEREVEVHGGVTNWYLEIANPPRSFRVDLGYLSASGKYFGICRSNTVTMPSPDSADAIDENWKDIAENYEKVYALSGGYSEENASGELQELFEERLQRPMTPPNSAQFGMGAERMIARQPDFDFQVDAEMILFGATKPDARVTLAGEPVKLRTDGSFALRLAMPDKRQVLPIVATSSNGIEQRTVVIAIERNTKVLEPMVREQSE